MLSWNWDESASESGAVHESVANTDHNDSTKLKQGYDYANFSEITPDPVGCWPLHEDSGSTLYDVAGTFDGTYYGPTLGQTGILGTSSPSWDATDDYARVQDPFDANADFTLMGWYRTSNTNRAQLFFKRDKSDFDGPIMGINQQGGSGVDGYITFGTSDGSTYVQVTDNSQDWSDGNWHHAAMTWDDSAGEVRAYMDGALLGSDSGNVGTTTNVDLGIGNEIFTGYAYPFGGEIADCRAYQTILSQSQIQTLYDVVNTQGAWESTTKTL